MTRTGPEPGLPRMSTELPSERDLCVSGVACQPSCAFVARVTPTRTAVSTLSRGVLHISSSRGAPRLRTQRPGRGGHGRERHTQQKQNVRFGDDGQVKRAVIPTAGSEMELLPLAQSLHAGHRVFPPSSSFPCSPVSSGLSLHVSLLRWRPSRHRSLPLGEEREAGRASGAGGYQVSGQRSAAAEPDHDIDLLSFEERSAVIGTM